MRSWKHCPWLKMSLFLSIYTSMTLNIWQNHTYQHCRHWEQMWDCPWVPHLHNVHLCFGDCIMQCLLLFLDNAYNQIYLNLKFSSSRIHVLHGPCVCYLCFLNFFQISNFKKTTSTIISEIMKPHENDNIFHPNMDVFIQIVRPLSTSKF